MVVEKGAQIYPWNRGSDPTDCIIQPKDLGDVKRMAALRRYCLQEYENASKTSEVRQICIHHITGTALELLRRIAEAIFHGSSTSVDIYTTSTQKPTSTIDRTTFGVMISEPGKSYKDILGRQALMMTLDKDHSALENLRSAMHDDGSLKSRKLGSEETFHIRGVSSDTTKEDINAVKNITVRVERQLCNAEERCPIFEEPGHKTGSNKYVAFKEARLRGRGGRSRISIQEIQQSPRYSTRKPP
ncbi:hypothetical protein JTB14_026272 [Gonioctena quinquepunctata]|nr:hypothetical protein JTB14_026272 [Gonioctena quinquepunctata]